MRAKPTLLVVDDEAGPRQSLRVVFKDDYKLLLAEDGPAAIELAEKHRVDVAIVDIRMAGMSGIEVLERLKFVDPNIEVVIMTAFETADTIRQALRLRACDYISKPFDIATMRAAVDTAMKRRSLNSELQTNAEKLKELQNELQEQILKDEIARKAGEIYGCIIHDINSPLTIISGLLQSISDFLGGQSALAGEDLDFVKDRLKRLTRQVTNCIQISRRYLSLLRGSSNGGETRVWINQILIDVQDLLRFNPSIRSSRLQIHPLAEDVLVPANGTDLIQILVNLSLNALRASPQHHWVEIRGQVLNHPLQLADFQDGPEDRFINREGFNNRQPLLALSVQDNGPGITPEVMARIFRPYFTTQPNQQGTGLGLRIVDRLLREAHGAVHAHSKVGQGTVFTVYLPALLEKPSKA